MFDFHPLTNMRGTFLDISETFTLCSRRLHLADDFLNFNCAMKFILKNIALVVFYFFLVFFSDQVFSIL